MEICESSGLPTFKVPRLPQSSGHIKWKLHVWRAQKCNAIIGAETVLTSAKPQTTLLHKGQYRAECGNIRTFGLTNPHGTAFEPRQWLY